MQQVYEVPDYDPEDDEVMILPHPSRANRKPDTSVYDATLQKIGDEGMKQVIERYHAFHPGRSYQQAKRDIRQGVNVKWACQLLSDDVSLRAQAVEMI